MGIWDVEQLAQQGNFLAFFSGKDFSWETTVRAWGKMTPMLPKQGTKVEGFLNMVALRMKDTLETSFINLSKCSSNPFN